MLTRNAIAQWQKRGKRERNVSWWKMNGRKRQLHESILHTNTQIAHTQHTHIQAYMDTTNAVLNHSYTLIQMYGQTEHTVKYKQEN